MQGFYVLTVLTVLLGWYRAQRTPTENAVTSKAAGLTARQILQTADLLGHYRSQGGAVADLCRGDRPSTALPIPGADDMVVYCTEHNGRIVVWATEFPGLATALRQQSHDSKLLARVTRGHVITLSDPAIWPVSLPAAAGNGTLVYIN